MLRAQNSVPPTHTPARAHTRTHAPTHTQTRRVLLGTPVILTQPLEVICTVTGDELARQGDGQELPIQFPSPCGWLDE